MIQYNKRDLPDAMAIEDLHASSTPGASRSIEAIAPRGEGVFPTLKALAARVLESVNKGGLAAPRPRPAAARPAPVGPTHTAPPPVRKPASATPVVSAPTGSPAARPATPAIAAAAAAPARHTAGAATAVEDEPTRPQPSSPAPKSRLRPSSPAPSARVEAPHASMQDRVVSMRGLNRPRMGAKIPLFLALAGLIAGAIYFVVSHV